MLKQRHLPRLFVYPVAKLYGALCSLLFAICFLFTSPIQAYKEVEFEDKYKFATSSALGDYITPIVRASIIGAGVITFLLFLGGGVLMIANAGDPQAQEKGKSAITAAVIGLVLVVSAYWIIQIIEFLTGVAILSSGL